jgi:hypothetical protein
VNNNIFVFKSNLAKEVIIDVNEISSMEEINWGIQSIYYIHMKNKDSFDMSKESYEELKERWAGLYKDVTVRPDDVWVPIK